MMIGRGSVPSIPLNGCAHTLPSPKATFFLRPEIFNIFLGGGIVAIHGKSQLDSFELFHLAKFFESSTPSAYAAGGP